MPLHIIKGDITKMDVQVIVNAANQSLRGGGGVDGAIHRAAGPGLLRECIAVGSCPTGEARMTLGYDLPAGHVVHTPGPVWRGGSHGEGRLLSSCYFNSLSLAAEHGFTTIAFPSISTGVYGYPVEQAATVAVSTIMRFLADHPQMDVTMVCFDAITKHAYDQALQDYLEA